MERYTKSRSMFAEAKETLAAGVSSNLRLAMQPVPIFVKESKGVRLTDVDGNEYIDYIMAYGPQILGHSHPVVVEAIKNQVEIGQAYGAQHEGEIELSKRITKYVPCAELVSFSSTGSEAVQTALRISRAYTGRRKFVKFDGHYHGWFDNVFTSFNSSDSYEKIPGTKGQNPDALDEMIIIPWNDLEAFEKVMNEQGEEIAAVITEPVMCNSGCIEPLPGFLEKVREITAKLDIVFIFDEVITGFRLGLGGAQQSLNITPDLVTLGKAVAGGLPLSAVGGKREIMKLIADNEIFHMGTFNGNPLCTASGIAAIDYLAQNNGRVYDEMSELSNYITKEIKALAEQQNLPLVINKKGPVFHTMFTEHQEVTAFHQFKDRDAGLFSTFAARLLDEGVTVRPSGLWYLSTAHTKEDIDLTLEKIEKVLKQLSSDRAAI